MDLLTPDLGLLFWQVVVFLGLFFILRAFAWKPITDSLHERENNIQSALDLAEKTRLEMTALKADNEKLLAQARRRTRSYSARCERSIRQDDC